MISEIRIQNFKSIQDLTLKPGRVTVLIGANGSGKSNILEGIAFAAGAAANKLDNEFLFNRGLRVTDDAWMRSAFPADQDEAEMIELPPTPIQFTVRSGDTQSEFKCLVSPKQRSEDRSFEGWSVHAPVSTSEAKKALQERETLDEILRLTSEIKGKFTESREGKSSPKRNRAFPADFEEILKQILTDVRISQRKSMNFSRIADGLDLLDFIIYAPENSVLRTPPPEGAISPLGAKGEGLFKLLQSFADPKINRKYTKRFDDLKNRLRLFGWFEDMLAPDDAATAQARLQLRDRWLAPDRAVFDQRSANEGFLYVLFYFVLMMSWRTPKFFAIDNLDNALNPKLCAELMQQIVELARTYGKQVICTVHNPAILEGLDLTRDDERLYAVRRDAEGRTVLRRIHAPQPQPGEDPASLSDAFLRGLLGGLPDNF